MAINTASSLTISAAGTTVATTDAAGTFFHTNRPYFWVSQSASPTAVGSDIIFNSVGVNVGSHYNATNGRFTAPVSGTYHFTYRQLSQNAATAGEYQFYLLLNNTTSFYLAVTQKRLANSWHSNEMGTNMFMAAGDYVTVRYVAGNSTTYTDSNYVQFSGHLIG